MRDGMRDLLTGLRLLGQGQRWAYRHRRDWRFGMIPALITLVGYGAALAGLVVWGPDLVGWATPFADHWAEPWRGLLRGGLDVLLFCGVLLGAVVSFTAVTLLVGQPFYEALAARVDRAEGGAPEPPELPLWRELWMSARDSVFLLVRVAAFGVVLFAAGFLPIVGQTAVPAAGFCVSGFFLTVELAGVAMQRREVPLRTRLALLRGRLLLTLGFGVPLVLAFLLPFVAVVLMPGAVAGATLLTRELLPAAGSAGPEADGAEPASGGGDLER
jgi:CysZ protein